MGDVLEGFGKLLMDRVREESDGLSGDLYTEDGWIQKYSSQRYEEI